MNIENALHKFKLQYDLIGELLKKDIDLLSREISEESRDILIFLFKAKIYHLYMKYY